MGIRRRVGFAALVVFLMLVAIALLSKTCGQVAQVKEIRSVAIPGAGVHASLSYFFECELFEDRAILRYGTQSLPELVGLDGSLLWTFNPAVYPDPLAGERSMGVCIGENGWIYVGTEYNSVYAFDTTLGYRWRTRLNGSKVWCAHPVYSPDGIVYVVTPDYLHAIDADGNLIWEMEVPGIGHSAPLIDAGRDRIYCVSENLEIVALNSLGEELWRTGHCTIGLDRPLIAGDGTIVCPDRLDGVITAVTPEGKTRWKVTTTSPGGMFNDWWWVALGADDVVYYAEENATGRCSLTVCDIDGTRLWSWAMPCEVDCPLVLADGRIIVTKGHGYESNPINEFLYKYLKPKTNSMHMQVAILDRQGRITGLIAPEYELFTERPLLTGTNELLLIDEHGVLHVYQL